MSLYGLFYNYFSRHFNFYKRNKQLNIENCKQTCETMTSAGVGVCEIVIALLFLLTYIHWVRLDTSHILILPNGPKFPMTKILALSAKPTASNNGKRDKTHSQNRPIFLIFFRGKKKKEEQLKLCIKKRSISGWAFQGIKLK